MKTVSLFNKHSVFLFFAAFFINLIFLYFNYETRYYDIYKLMHGEIAYNITQHNSTLSNPEQLMFLRANATDGKTDYILDVKKLLSVDFGKPYKPAIYHVHIGYSIVIGLLWKITKTFSFIDILLLQVFIFSFLMFLWYQIGCFLFNSRKIALYSGIALLFFFPIFFINVHVLRDIWQYYGIIFLLYGVLAYIHEKINIFLLLIFFSFVALCQFIRQPMFFIVFALSIILIGTAFFEKKWAKKIITILMCLWVTNSVFFWIPFMVYNKKLYNEYIVGPAGDGLLQGVGSMPNPWGYPAGESAQSIMIMEKYGIDLNDHEYDKIAKKLAWDAIKERPFLYIKGVVQRICYLMLPSIIWYSWNLTSCKLFEDEYDSIFDHINDIAIKITKDWRVFIDILFRAIYTRLFVLIGYLGVLLLLLRRRYFIPFLLFGGMISTAYSISLSHIEDRYFIPTYVLFSFFVGYLIYEIIEYFYKKKSVE